ncbi:hypothetical protein [Pseudoalteromonas sp. Ld20]|uniref:hypothetical protein n=1 Tax=Pseudoalteromonas sp. Ld20 TaxID=649165 RepID=UPI00386AF3E6
MKGNIKKNSIGKIIEKVTLGLIFFIVIFAVVSYFLILHYEKTLIFDFTAKGFLYFTTIFSFPIKCISVVIALFTLWSIAHNLNRTRIAFTFNQLSSELGKCEEEIKNILTTSFAIEEIINIIDSNLYHPKKREIREHFSKVLHPSLKLEEVISQLIKFEIKEADKIFHIYTQKLSLRLQRYAIALLEINNLSDEQYFVRYYASKYITTMKELYHFGAEIDIELIHLTVQLSSMEQELMR